jgi:hypothetical protein
MAISRHFVGPHRPAAKPATALSPFIPVGLAIGLSAVAWSFDGALPYRALPALVASSLLGFWAWWLFLKNRMVPSLWAGFIASACLSVGVFGFAQLDLRSLKLSDRLAEVARNLPCENPSVATLGYREPSLVFLTGTGLEMVDSGAQAAGFLRQGGCRVVFVEKRHEGDFRAENERLGQQPVLSTRVHGFNINSGRRLDIAAYATGF